MTLTIRGLTEQDFDTAEHLRRLAFGTLLGVPDPLTFRGDSALIPGRARAFPDGGMIAEVGGQPIAVAMANHWGSIGVFGPIAVHPDHWRKGVARQLLDATLPIFDRWHCRIVGLFTFPERATHVRLYQSVGFWPRYLTPIMVRAVGGPSPVSGMVSLRTSTAERGALIGQCTSLTASIFEDLDLTKEIELALDQSHSDALVLTEGSQIVGLAIVHIGKATEAGSGKAYIKFACVRSGTEAAHRFARLIDGCNDVAHRQGATELSGGVSSARIEAYRMMIDLGFRATLQGVAMHRPFVEAYDRPGLFVLDDWR
jgi:GNAT superfamily N-acetyltransferase